MLARAMPRSDGRPAIALLTFELDLEWVDMDPELKDEPRPKNLKVRILDAKIHPNHDYYNMAISMDCRKVAITGKKETKFFLTKLFMKKEDDEKEESGFNLVDEYDIKAYSTRDRHMLMSPDFSTAVTENKFQGEKYICLTHLGKEDSNNVEMRLMPKSLMNTRSVFKGQKFVFFTSDFKYVGIKTNADAGYYSLYRINNSKLICNLRYDYCDFALTLGHGGFMVALGIIDVRTRTCLPWSL